MSRLWILGYALPVLAVLRGDPDPLESSVAAFLVAAVVAGPFIILVHELAHAAVAVALTGQRVSVEIGRQPAAVRFALGRIDVRWDPRPGQAYCQLLPSRVSRPRVIAIVLAGPVSTLLLGVVFLLAAKGQPHALAFGALTLWAVAGICAISAVFNLAPATFVTPLVGGGQIAQDANDGMLIWRALRGYRGHEIWEPELREVRSAPQPPPRASTSLDPRASAAIDHALRDARAAEVDYLGTEHVLCGLANADADSAALLAGAHVTVRCRAQAAAAGEAPRLPMTPRLRKAMHRARTSLSLSGSPSIAPEHILLGLLGDPDFCASLGDRPEALRTAVLARLAERTQVPVRAASRARSCPT